jgi:hypothetical protein
VGRIEISQSTINEDGSVNVCSLYFWGTASQHPGLKIYYFSSKRYYFYNSIEYGQELGMPTAKEPNIILTKEAMFFPILNIVRVKCINRKFFRNSKISLNP